MDLSLESVNGRSVSFQLHNRNGKIEISLDDYCDIIVSFFPSKESVDKAIDELIKLRKEVYGENYTEI